MPLAKYSSTSGNLIIAGLWNIYIVLGESWMTIASISIPWRGTTTYVFAIRNISYYEKDVSIKLNSTEYGPYTLPPQSFNQISIGYYISTASKITVYMIAEYTSVCSCEYIILKTGNADCMYKASLLPASFSYVGSATMIT